MGALVILPSLLATPMGALTILFMISKALGGTSFKEL
jgi:hypothetical protein